MAPMRLIERLNRTSSQLAAQARPRASTAFFLILNSECRKMKTLRARLANENHGRILFLFDLRMTCLSIKWCKDLGDRFCWRFFCCALQAAQHQEDFPSEFSPHRTCRIRVCLPRIGKNCSPKGWAGKP